MTAAPSQTPEAAELEDAWNRLRKVFSVGFEEGYEHEIDRMSAAVVTAASAQAAIDAEKARADRLASELEKWKRLKGYADDQIKVERKAYRSLLADHEARAALQQETQP